MEKRKHMWSDTTVQIFLRNLLLVCVAVILTGGISLYLALTIRQNDMDTAIQNLACIVSQMDIVRESLEAGEALPELKEELDLLSTTAIRRMFLLSVTKTVSAIIIQNPKEWERNSREMTRGRF